MPKKPVTPGKEIAVSVMLPLDVAASSAPATSDALAGLGDPCVEVADMIPHWEPIIAALSGTPGMRKTSTTWLPREPKEKQASYDARVNRSIVFNFFRDAVTKAVSKPFAKDVQIKPEEDKLPEELQPMADDMDRQGHNLTAFGRMMFAEAVTYRAAYMMIEVPVAPDGVDGGNLGVQQALDIRPYVTLISAPNLIGWKKDDQGNYTEARVREWIVVRRGFKEERVEHIRLWRAAHDEQQRVEGSDDSVTVAVPAGWTLYMRSGSGFSPVATGSINYPGPGLPLVDLCLEDMPPFEDVAWLTVSHWQSYSDYRNILRFVSIGILMFMGVTPEELDGTLTIAGNHGVLAKNELAKGQYVEHSGAAIAALERCLLGLEARADVASLHPMIDSVGQATATGRSIDEGKSLCSLQAWAREAERALEACFRVAAAWIKKPLPDDFAIDIPDFTLSMRAQQDVLALIDLMKAGILDKRTGLEQIKQRGVLSEDADVDEIMDRVKQEGPALGSLYGDPAAGDPNADGAPKPAGTRFGPDPNY